VSGTLAGAENKVFDPPNICHKGLVIRKGRVYAGMQTQHSTAISEVILDIVYYQAAPETYVTCNGLDILVMMAFSLYFPETLGFSALLPTLALKAVHSTSVEEIAERAQPHLHNTCHESFQLVLINPHLQCKGPIVRLLTHKTP
jgi:hypothetical protein